jgi:hypothetical protein
MRPSAEEARNLPKMQDGAQRHFLAALCVRHAGYVGGGRDELTMQQPHFAGPVALSKSSTAIHGGQYATACGPGLFIRLCTSGKRGYRRLGGVGETASALRSRDGLILERLARPLTVDLAWLHPAR